MLSKYFVFAVATATTAVASLHHVAYCRDESLVWGHNMDTVATECACKAYGNRHTGSKWWDSCPDCVFDGTYCNSKLKHIGGDEMTYYCESICKAKGAMADGE